MTKNAGLNKAFINTPLGNAILEGDALGLTKFILTEETTDTTSPPPT